VSAINWLLAAAIARRFDAHFDLFDLSKKPWAAGTSMTTKIATIPMTTRISVRVNATTTVLPGRIMAWRRDFINAEIEQVLYLS
jgi:hypothetical protein